MRISNGKIIIESADLGHLIRVCVRQYQYRSNNELPTTIVVKQSANFIFKQSAASPEQSIPITFEPEQERQNGKSEEVSNDTANRHSRTSRNRKIAGAGVDSSQDESEPDKQG